jgi:hypothetical protein
MISKNHSCLKKKKQPSKITIFFVISFVNLSIFLLNRSPLDESSLIKNELKQSEQLKEKILKEKEEQFKYLLQEKSDLRLKLEK